MFYKIKKLLLVIPLVFIISSCGTNSTDNFDTLGNSNNMQGVWATWQESGNLEFIEFLGSFIIHGYISPDGYVHFVRLGGYHFHGPIAHAMFNLEFTSYDGGTTTNIWEDINFQINLNYNEDVLQFAPMQANVAPTVFEFVGGEPYELDAMLNHVTVWETLQISEVIDEMLFIFTEPHFD